VLPPAANDPNIAVAAIRRLLSSGEFDTAEKRLEVADGALSPAEVEFWHGVLELRRGNGHEAIRRLRRAQKLQNSPYTSELLGLAYYSLSQFHLFETFMLEAIRQLPKAFAPHYYLGRYYASAAMTDFARGRQYLEQAVRLNPHYFRSFYYLGYCYESDRGLDEAAQAYGESIRLAKLQNHVFALPYEGMARILTLQNELAAALTYADAAVEMSGQDPEAHKTRAAIYDRQKRTLEAVKEWELVAALDPTNGAARYRLVRLYTEQGRKEDAARALEQFRTLARLYGTDNP
jgi:tetratricopeptide (TPR) repeat protein